MEEAVPLNVALSHTGKSKEESDTALRPNIPHEPAGMEHCKASEEKKACEKDPDTDGPSNASEFHHKGGEHDHSSNLDKESDSSYKWPTAPETDLTKDYLTSPFAMITTTTESPTNKTCCSKGTCKTTATEEVRKVTVLVNTVLHTKHSHKMARKPPGEVAAAM